MNTETDLNTRLTREADSFFRNGGTELDLGQVLDRAGQIRRGRRMRATILMAACVLAIAAPTALIAANRHVSTAPQPTHETTEKPQTKDDLSPLSLGDLHIGDTPHRGFAQDGTWQLRVAANGLGGPRGEVAAAAAMKDGAMVAMRTESGEMTAYFIDEQGGTSEQSWPMESGSAFAVSKGGDVAAFVEPDGTVVAVQDRGAQAFELGTIPQGSGVVTTEGPPRSPVQPVAVGGEDCSGQANCKVYVTTNGVDPATYILQPDTGPKALPAALDRTVDVSVDQRFAGFTSISDDGSCSAVRDADLGALWQTCDHRLLAFSPDGKHLLAGAAYASGIGDGELTVLDSNNGKVALDLKTAGEGSLYQMVWEDDSHVLATVYEQGHWAVLRIGLNGSREYAVEPVEGADATRSPFVLPTL